MRYLLLIIKNIRRNRLRTILTALGTMVLVLVMTIIWTVLAFIDKQTTEKANNYKMIVTERNKVPSRLPRSFISALREGGARSESDIIPTDYMTWAFYGGSLDKAKGGRENFIFFVAAEPEKVPTMMDDLDQLSEEDQAWLQRAVARVRSQPNACIIGKDQLKTNKKQVGERIKVSGFFPKDIDLEFEIIDTFPDAAVRYSQTSIMNIQYLFDALDKYKAINKKDHPQAAEPVAFMMLRVADRGDYEQLSAQVVESPLFTAPYVRCESLSSSVSTFLEGWKDIFWGLRWLLAPAILATLSLVIANAISISVRERRMEIAVLKVLGFSPGQVLILILGEAVLIGSLAGIASSIGTYVLINVVMGGMPFPILWFGKIFIPVQAIWWGLAIGSGTAFVGSLIPAWSARSVRVADVFSKIA